MFLRGIKNLLLLVLFVTEVEASNDFVIRVSDFAPQYFRDANGHWTGIDVEMARALAKEAGFNPVFVEIPWSRALRELNEGNVHMMVALARSEERERFVRYIGIERVSSMALVVRSEFAQIKVENFDDLLHACQKHGHWGVQRDVHYSPEFDERLRTDKAFSNCFTRIVGVQQNIDKAQKGRILGFFEDATSMEYLLRHNRELENLKMHGFVMYRHALYFGASRTLPKDTIERLKSAYWRLENNGTFEKLRAKVW